MGAMNVVGTIGSGWICDRFGRRGPLAIYYFVRGLSLLFLLYVWNVPSLHFWAAIFGLNYISTVPPTTTLTANIFGRYSVGELSAGSSSRTRSARPSARRWPAGSTNGR